MIRLIAMIKGAQMAIDANVGGESFSTEYETFDIECPELERFLTPSSRFATASVIGAQVLRGGTMDAHGEFRAAAEIEAARGAA